MREFFGGNITLHEGDCLEKLAELADNSIDSCVTDPPYHLTSITKRFGKSNMDTPANNPFLGQKAMQYKRLSTGFMGKVWDGGDIAFHTELWAEVLRVLKPGAHMVAFSGTRTYHRMACAIEDAGFEIRDQLAWVYGSGFPKSHDIGKAIDKTLGAVRALKRTPMGPTGNKYTQGLGDSRPWREKAALVGYHESASDEPVTAAAIEWDGWGTALKPAWEPIVLARKPLSEKTVAANVLRWGTGALNIDACRIPAGEQINCTRNYIARGMQPGGANGEKIFTKYTSESRWPANLCHDGSAEVLECFPETNSTLPGNIKPSSTTANIYGKYNQRSLNGHIDSGSAARFFYTSKADSYDRLGSKHPTVKPVDLMQWLVRLITPPQGLVLDLFAGTGTTAEACFREGMRCILMEREEEYIADIERRMALIMAGPDERSRESIKARGREADAGPLFGGISE